MFNQTKSTPNQSTTFLFRVSNPVSSSDSKSYHSSSQHQPSSCLHAPYPDMPCCPQASPGFQFARQTCSRLDQLRSLNVTETQLTRQRKP